MIGVVPGQQPPPVQPAPGAEAIIPASGIASPPNVERMTLDEFANLPTAAQVSIRRYNTRTRLKAGDATLAAAVAATLVGNDPDRIGLVIINTGLSNPFSVTTDDAKTVAQGDTIGPNGGAYKLLAAEDAEGAAREVHGISTAGTTVHIEEIIGYGPLVLLPPEIEPL